MSLRDFTDSRARLDELAAIQQITIIQAIYDNTPDVIESLLTDNGGGQVIRYNWAARGLPPNYVLIQQGDRFIITIAGTINAEQWASHLAGAVGGDHRQAGVKCHLAMGLIADQIYDQIRPLLPTDLSNKRISISGHSMGAGVGILLAHRFSEVMNAEQIELLQIASPKVLTRNYNVPRYRHHTNVYNRDDPVPQMPPTSNTIVATGIGQLFNQYFSNQIEWSHFGNQYQLNPSGNINRNLMSPGDLFSSFTEAINLNFGAHSPSEYTVRLQRTLAEHPRNLETQTLNQRIETVRTAPIQQNINGNFDAPSIDNIARMNQAYFPLLGSVITPENVGQITSVIARVNLAQSRLMRNILDERRIIMASPSGYWKCTLFLNNSLYGHSETYYLKGNQEIKDAITKTREMIDYRAEILGKDTATGTYVKSKGSPRIEFARVSDALNKNYSLLVPFDANAHFFGYGSNNGNSAADVFSTVLAVRMRCLNDVDGSTVVYSNHLWAGITDASISSGVWDATTSQGPAQPGQGNAALTAGGGMRVWLNYLTRAQSPWGTMGQSTLEEKKDATAFVYVDGDLVKLNVNNNYNTNDIVRVTAANAKGFNGTYKIIALSNTQIQLATRFPDQRPLPTVAKIQRIQGADGSKFQQFYKFVQPVAGLISPYGVKVSKKNLAKEFLGTSFTRRGSRKK